MFIDIRRFEFQTAGSNRFLRSNSLPIKNKGVVRWKLMETRGYPRARIANRGKQDGLAIEASASPES